MKLWKLIPIANLVYEAFVVSKAEMKAESGDDIGHADTNLCRFLFLEGQTPAMFADTYVHELVHGFLSATGLGSFLRASLRLDEDAYYEWEEQFIRLLTPNLHLQLTRMGWKPPRPPGVKK